MIEDNRGRDNANSSLRCKDYVVDELLIPKVYFEFILSSVCSDATEKSIGRGDSRVAVEITLCTLGAALKHQ